MNTPESFEALTIDNTEIITNRLVLHFPRNELEIKEAVSLAFDAAHLPADKYGRVFTAGMTWDAPKSPDDIEAFMKTQKEQWGIQAYNFSIWNTNHEIIGNCGIIKKDEALNTWSLGYWMHPKFQGKGFMTEAANGLVQFGFKELNADIVTARAMHWNTASQTVLQKCGMQRIQLTEPLFFNKNGTMVEEYVYEISKDAYLKTAQ